MAGMGDFLLGAAQGGLMGADAEIKRQGAEASKRADADLAYRRQLALADYKAEMESRYKIADRKAMDDYLTSEPYVNSQIEADRRLQEGKTATAAALLKTPDYLAVEEHGIDKAVEQTKRTEQAKDEVELENMYNKAQKQVEVDNYKKVAQLNSIVDIGSLSTDGKGLTDEGYWRGVEAVYGIPGLTESMLPRLKAVKEGKDGTFTDAARLGYMTSTVNQAGAMAQSEVLYDFFGDPSIVDEGQVFGTSARTHLQQKVKALSAAALSPDKKGENVIKARTELDKAINRVEEAGLFRSYEVNGEMVNPRDMVNEYMQEMAKSSIETSKFIATVNRPVTASSVDELMANGDAFLRGKGDIAGFDYLNLQIQGIERPQRKGPPPSALLQEQPTSNIDPNAQQTFGGGAENPYQAPAPAEGQGLLAPQQAELPPTIARPATPAPAQAPAAAAPADPVATAMQMAAATGSKPGARPVEEVQPQLAKIVEKLIADGKVSRDDFAKTLEALTAAYQGQ